MNTEVISENNLITISSELLTGPYKFYSNSILLLKSEIKKERLKLTAVPFYVHERRRSNLF